MEDNGRPQQKKKTVKVEDDGKAYPAVGNIVAVTYGLDVSSEFGELKCAEKRHRVTDNSSAPEHPT